MKRVGPSAATTTVIDEHTWKPTSAASLSEECAHLLSVASRNAGASPTMLYRGHRDSAWALNSTFARWAENQLGASTREDYFELPRYFLRDFGDVYGPSDQLRRVASMNKGLDEWFELMKRIQQHNENQEFEGVSEIGTNLMDWSLDLDVALTFASLEQSIQGAVYLFDAQAAGQILIQQPYRQVLDRWKATVEAGKMHGNPLLFCPPRQLDDARANRQAARYLAQIDLRLPVDVIWAQYEHEQPGSGRIWQKLLIDADLKAALASELAGKGLDQASLMA